MNTKLKIAFVAAVVVGLAGCAPTVFTRPGTSLQQAQRDVAQCKYENHGRYAAAEAINPFFAIDEGQATKQCLEAKGYTGRKQ